MAKSEKCYFVISSSDGEVYIRQLTKEELLKEITDFGEIQILEDLPRQQFELGSRRCVLIIKGEIVVPKAKRVVTEFDVQ